MAAQPRPQAPAAPAHSAGSGARAPGRRSSTGRGLLRDQGVDPYALWGIHTGFAAWRGRRGEWPESLEFVVELSGPYDPATMLNDLAVWSALPADLRAMTGHQAITISVPPTYHPDASGWSPRFVTLRVRIKPGLDRGEGAGVGRLVALLAALVSLKEVVRVQMGLTVPDRRDGAQEDSGRRPDPARRMPRGLPPHAALVVGVLEDALPFAHPSLRRPDGGTRLAALWEQAQPSLPGLVTGYGYGRVFEQPELDQWMQAFTDASGRVDDEALYRAPELSSLNLRRRQSHGAAVLGLLAGGPRRWPQPGRTAECALGEAQSCVNDGQADPVATAPVVAVRLPREQVLRAAARWLAVNALDGVHFILQHARALGGGDHELPCTVVNLSYGGMAGAHDGTGMLELALDELCGHHPRLALVVASGNAHGVLADETQPPQVGVSAARLPAGLHAGPMRLEPGERVELGFFVPPEQSLDSLLELWFWPDGASIQANEAGRLLPGEVQVSVRTPDGRLARDSSGHALQVRAGQAGFAAREGQVAAGVVFPLRPSQSLRSSMALLAVRPTDAEAGPSPAWPGVWRVQVHNRGQRSLDLQAWAERDDHLAGRGAGQAARIVPLRHDRAVPPNDHNTFGSATTGALSFTAGALQALRDARGQRRVSTYASADRAGGPGPLGSAQADQGPALGGIRVMGNLGGSVSRMDGSSIAAPQLARALAGAMAAGQDREALRAALKAQSPGDGRRGADRSED